MIPQSLVELQSLIDTVLLGIGDKHKVTVVISNRIKRYYGKAYTEVYIRTGRRKIVITQQFLDTLKKIKDLVEAALRRLIEVILHEIAHFKLAKVRKLRKLYLKGQRNTLTREDVLLASKYTRKKDHTKKFYNILDKLDTRFFASQIWEEMQEKLK